MELILDGSWDTGIDRSYTTAVPVPGLAGDPRLVTPGVLWYRRSLHLPASGWIGAHLLLKGARFRPRVFIDGDEVAAAEGGMGPILLPLIHPALQPGAIVDLEIALAPLDAVPEKDASRIPPADHWRSNVSSCLWDAVVLRLHGDAAFTRVVPWADAGADTLTVACSLAGAAAGCRVVAALLDDGDREVATGTAEVRDAEARPPLVLDDACHTWSPEHPVCYRLRLRLERDGHLLDEWSQTWGRRDFRVAGRDFRLNGDVVHLRAGSVVWHRFLRDPEAADLAWDPTWWAVNVVERLQAHGANTLRFHLGMPPEFLLDLCDRAGLMVQAEWSFFHGLDASPESLRAQWPVWFELCLRHPSVVLMHPWNETEARLLDMAFGALEAICPAFPPLVISHRDVCHVHKYWWSLFENVGCYYDSRDLADQPIMVDEFGGNYLDGAGEPGGYPTLRETFLRFLGEGHDVAARLQLQCDANARVAEYWRRLDAAGFSPFCLLGSPEDGNHHFLGRLADGEPKPVWDALTAAYAPVAVSLDVWDRNHPPGTVVTWPLHLFNDTAADHDLEVAWRLRGDDGPSIVQGTATWSVPAGGHRVEAASFSLPSSDGAWTLEVELLDPPRVLRPVISSWRIRTLAPRVPAALVGRRIGIPAEEVELREFAGAMGLTPVAPADGDLLVLGRASWPTTVASGLPGSAEDRPTLLVDVGPLDLGQGYLPEGQTGPLQAVRRLTEPRQLTVDLAPGVFLHFHELGEPESCLHPTTAGQGLLHHLHPEHLRLWNGLRGGLIVPAWELSVGGLARDSLLAIWTGRGADGGAIRVGRCVAYELAGQYAFAPGPDPVVAEELRQRVRFLVEDAPALAGSINPEGRIVVHDLGDLHTAADGEVLALQTLACCGRDLAQGPVVDIHRRRGGRIIVSQAITAGRLTPGHGHPDITEANPHYAIRVDPAAQQVVLNLLAMLLGRE